MPAAQCNSQRNSMGVDCVSTDEAPATKLRCCEDSVGEAFGLTVAEILGDGNCFVPALAQAFVDGQRTPTDAKSKQLCPLFGGVCPDGQTSSWQG